MAEKLYQNEILKTTVDGISVDEVFLSCFQNHHTKILQRNHLIRFQSRQNAFKNANMVTGESAVTQN